jgi:hypothetical protein
LESRENAEEEADNRRGEAGVLEQRDLAAGAVAFESSR